MRRTSRRAVLAAAGSALLAGCSGSNVGGTTRTTTETATRTRTEDEYDPPEWVPGLDPLGYRAVPPESESPPAYGRERRPGTLDGDIVAVVPTADGFAGLLYRFGDEGPGTPALVRLDADGGVVSQRPLSELPSNRAYLLERLGETTVVGGMHEPEGEPRTWLRGYRDGEVAFDYSRRGTTYAALTTVDGALVAAGTLGWQREGENGLGAILTRLSPDGTVEREVTVDEPGVEPRFWSVTATPGGLLAAGALDNRPWVVAYAPDGRERWRRLVETDGAYIVERLAVGETGRYALAQTNQFATGNNHLLLLSLGPEGAVEWARVFDPNYDDYASGPRELYDAGVVDIGGPLLVGQADRRGWLAATAPEGAMRWAGYDPRRDPEARPTGVTRVGDGVLVNGGLGEPGEPGVQPWLAWLTP